MNKIRHLTRRSIILGAMMTGQMLLWNPAPIHAQPAQEKITIGLLPALMINLPVWVGQEKGYFEEKNLTLDMQTIAGGGAQILAALVGGSVDLSYASIQQIALSQANGQALQMVVGNHTKLPYALVVQNDGPPAPNTRYPQVMQDLRGKRIGISSLGSDSHLKLLALLRGAGMTDKDVTIMQAGANPEAAFITGQYDALLAPEPVLSTITVGRKAGRLALDLRIPDEVPDVLKGQLYNGWVTTPERAKEPRVIRATEAIAKAIGFIRDAANTAEIETISAKYLKGIDPEVNRNQVAHTIENFNVTVSRQDVETSLKGLDLPKTVTYDDIIAGIARGN